MERHLPSPPQLPWMPDPKVFEPMAKLNATTSALAEVTRPMTEAIEGLPTPPQLPQMPDLTVFEPMAKLDATASVVAEVTRPLAAAREAMEGHRSTPPQLSHIPDLTTSELDALDTLEKPQAVGSPGLANVGETAITGFDTFAVDPGEVTAQAIRDEHERDRRLEQDQRRQDRWTYGVVALASGVIGAVTTEIVRQIAALLA